MRCDFIHRLTDVTHTRKSKEAWLSPISEYNGGVVVAAAASIYLPASSWCLHNAKIGSNLAKNEPWRAGCILQGVVH
jgi:hypothetical protein